MRAVWAHSRFTTGDAEAIALSPRFQVGSPAFILAAGGTVDLEDVAVPFGNHLAFVRRQPSFARNAVV
jgi:hypothetical protein